MTEQAVVKAHQCPYCSDIFDYRIELGMHVQKWHPGKFVAVSTSPSAPLIPTPQRPVKPQASQQEELIIEYNLAQSKQGLGELCPVLKDASGNIIDGFHRKGENADWREETLPWIDSPVKLELARLAVNFNRRRVTPQEVSDRISFLIKAGVSVEEIAQQTGISTRTIYKYKPANLKNPERVKTGKVGAEKLAESVQQRVNTHDRTQIASPRFQNKVDLEAEPPQIVDTVNNVDKVHQVEKVEEEPEEIHSSFGKEEKDFGAQPEPACICPHCHKQITTCPKA